MSASQSPPAGSEYQKSGPRFRQMLRSPHQLLALSFGLGLAPRAPGTWGSLGGFPLFLALQALPVSARIVAYLALIAIGSWAVGRAGEDFGEHDHPALVWDETIAMALVLEFTPISVTGWIAAFALFRLFDIWKPWPVYLADEQGRGGVFVILDDLLAAMLAIACVAALSMTGLIH